MIYFNLFIYIDNISFSMNILKKVVMILRIQIKLNNVISQLFNYSNRQNVSFQLHLKILDSYSTEDVA